MNSLLAKVFILFLSFVISSPFAYSQGNLLLTPRRLVMENGKKSGELNVANTGSDSARYVISVVEMRMKEDGTFENITEPDSGQLFASKYLRFFPRSVYLGPNEAQVIKVQLRNVSQMKPGEYRSHIYLRAVPDEKPLGELPEPEDPKAISVKLTAVFGFTIPVIVRIGETSAQVGLSNVSYNVAEDTIPTLEFTMNREGNMSVYGDLFVDHVAHDGIVTNVYIAKGLSVYTPNSKRQIKIHLNKVPNVNFRSGVLKITYTEHDDIKKQLAMTELKLD